MAYEYQNTGKRIYIATPWMILASFPLINLATKVSLSKNLHVLHKHVHKFDQAFK